MKRDILIAIVCIILPAIAHAGGSPNGAACKTNAECSSTFCQFAPFGTRGLCQQKSPPSAKAPAAAAPKMEALPPLLARPVQGTSGAAGTARSVAATPIAPKETRPAMQSPPPAAKSPAAAASPLPSARQDAKSQAAATPPPAPAPGKSASPGGWNPASATSSGAPVFAGIDPSAIQAAVSQAKDALLDGSFIGIQIPDLDCGSRSEQKSPPKAAIKLSIAVPAEAPTIQAAVDIAASGATITVDPSQTYQEFIDIKGKSVTIASAVLSQQVPIRAPNLGKPNIVFRCSGSGTFRGLDIEGGSIGVQALAKAPTDTIAIEDSYIGNVGVAVFAVGGEIEISNTTVSGTKQEGVVVAKASGKIQGSEFTNIGGIAVAARSALGIEVSGNVFESPIGEGGVFVEGGAASVVDNDFALEGKAFGIVLTHDQKAKDAKAVFEVSRNTIDFPLNIGIGILGNGTKLTQATVAENAVIGDMEKLKSFEGQSKTLADKIGPGTAASGLQVLNIHDGIGLWNLTAAINQNTTTNLRSGLDFSELCGTWGGNLSTQNAFGLVHFDDATDCKLTPALTYDETLGIGCDCLIGFTRPDGTCPNDATLKEAKKKCNLIYKNKLQNKAGTKGLDVPAPPEAASAPVSP